MYIKKKIKSYNLIINYKKKLNVKILKNFIFYENGYFFIWNIIGLNLNQKLLK